jgi:hypothetical protein
MGISQQEAKRLAREVEGLAIRIKVAAEDGRLTIVEVVSLLVLVSKLANHIVREAMD